MTSQGLVQVAESTSSYKPEGKKRHGRFIFAAIKIYNLKIILVQRNGSLLPLLLEKIDIPKRATISDLRRAFAQTELSSSQYDAFLERFGKIRYISTRDVYRQIRVLEDDDCLMRLCRDEMKWPGSITFLIEQARNPKYSKKETLDVPEYYGLLPADFQSFVEAGTVEDQESKETFTYAVTVNNSIQSHSYPQGRDSEKGTDKGDLYLTESAEQHSNQTTDLPISTDYPGYPYDYAQNGGEFYTGMSSAFFPQVMDGMYGSSQIYPYYYVYPNFMCVGNPPNARVGLVYGYPPFYS